MTDVVETNETNETLDTVKEIAVQAAVVITALTAGYVVIHYTKKKATAILANHYAKKAEKEAEEKK